jgi:hypothetical protein
VVWDRLFGIGRLTPEAFARRVADEARRRGRMANPVVDLEEFSIVDGDARLSLANVYRKFLELPRRARLDYLEKAILPEPSRVAGWDEARAVLRPVLRHGAYLRLAELQTRAARSDEEGHVIAHRPFAGALFATIAVDDEYQMAIVGDGHLVDWKVPFAEAFEIAVSNLRRVSDDPFVAIARGLWGAPWNDSYGAARLVLPEVLQRVCTNPYVCVPDRDTLLVADPKVPGSLKMLLDFVAATPERAYALTNQVFVLEDKHLRAIDIERDDPAFPVYRELLVREAAESYEAERATQTENDELFYAKYIATMTPEGEIDTFATWTETVDTLLPPADAIMFVRLDDEGELVQHWKIAWDDLVGTPGLVQPTDSVLPRWRTLAFPPDAWLDAHKRD